MDSLGSIPENADWRLAWGAAELAHGEQAVGNYRRAIELNPQDAALRCRLAFALTSRVTLDRDELRLAYSPEEERWRTTRPASPAATAAALTALGQAAQLDPDNGLIDALSAYVLFALHRDEEGMEALSRAMGKPRWQDYGLEAMRVAADRAEAAGVPRSWAKVGAHQNLSFRHSGALRQLEHFLTGLGRRFEAKGRDPEAIGHYRLAFLLANAVRANARFSNQVYGPDRWLGIIQGYWRADKSEVGRYISREPGEKRPWLEDKSLDELRFHRFLSYLQRHGAKQFAEEFAVTKVVLKEDRETLSDASWKMTNGWVLWTPALLSHFAQVSSLGPLVLFGMCALLAWLIRLSIRRPRPPTLLAALLVTGALVTGFSLERFWVLRLGMPFVFLVLMGAAAWQAVVWWRAGRRDGFRLSLLNWLRKVNVASLWAVVLAFTLFLALFIPVHIYGARLEAYYDQILTKGEIAALLGR